MIKIKILLLFLCLQNVYAQDTDNLLFQKVFGNKNETKEVTLDITLKDFIIGSITANIKNNKVIDLNGPQLNSILQKIIRDNKKNNYIIKNDFIKITELPFKVKYNDSDLKIAFEIPEMDLRPTDSDIFDDKIPYFAKKAVGPSPLSFATNYKVEKHFGKNAPYSNYYEGQTDSFLHLQDILVENQMHYLSTRKNNWYRQSSKLSYDITSRMERVELGDFSNPVMGYLQSKPMGGLSISRDFSINPYKNTSPSTSYEYEVTSRSLVKTFINNSLVKSEYLTQGRYSVKDVPLNNGMNKILVEVTDEFDKKRVFIFNQSGSLDLLAKNLNRYTLATGYTSTDTNTEKKYDSQKGLLITGFYQYGITDNITLAGYVQRNKQFTLLGADTIFSTNYGNVLVDFANSKNSQNNGMAISTTFQRSVTGAYWYSNHLFTTKLEYRGPWFNESGENYENRYDYLTSLSYTIPLFEKINLSVSGMYQHPRIAINPKYSYDSTITANFFQSNSLSLYLGRTKEEDNSWSTILYCFFNFSFENQQTFANAFYENQGQTKRISLINDSGKKINDLKTSASVEENETEKNGTIDLQYNTIYADLGIRESLSHTNSKQYVSKTSIRFLSSFAFVYDNKNYGLSISRPIASSFVIFKPSKTFKGQKFGVENDSSPGIFGESLISGLTPYQYKRILLNPTHLEAGQYLSQESYVLYPGHKSGHLFIVGEKIFLVARGILLDSKQQPLALKLGYFTSRESASVPFFTNRDGEFFIEGLSELNGKLEFDDGNLISYEIKNKQEQKGIIDLGKITLNAKE